jgi:hypothetical protein
MNSTIQRGKQKCLFWSLLTLSIDSFLQQPCQNIWYLTSLSNLLELVPPGLSFTNISEFRGIVLVHVGSLPPWETFLPQVEDDRTLRAWPCQASVEVKNSTSHVNSQGRKSCIWVVEKGSERYSFWRHICYYNLVQSLHFWLKNHSVSFLFSLLILFLTQLDCPISI